MTRQRSLQEELAASGDVELERSPDEFSLGAHDDVLSDSPLAALNDAEALPGDEAMPTSSHVDDDQATRAFAEKHKYLICSSGMLEKDFIAELDPQAEQGRSDASWILDYMGYWNDLRGVLSTGRERWDLSLAGLVLLGALCVALGWRRVFMGLGALTGGVGAGYVWKGGRQQDIKVDTPSRESFHHHVTSLLHISAKLDASVRQALEALDESDASLRLGLHRTCESLTDQFAEASSRLGGLVDKGELKVLAEMYDIPLVRKKVDSEEWREKSREHIAGGVPSPRRLSPPSTLRPQRLREPIAAWQMTPSQSLPPFTPRARGHEHHLSLLPAVALDGDRFTSVPRRTPRISKRASWDPAAWSRATQDVSALGLGSPKRTSLPHRVVLPRHERRITEADEEETGLRPLSLPSSPTPPRHLPKHASPLSGRIPHIRPSSTELTDLSAHISPPRTRAARPLDLPIPMSANPKRRSLQNLTYYPGGADLARTDSAVSDLQESRTRGMEGDRSRRASMHSHVSTTSIQSTPFSPRRPTHPSISAPLSSPPQYTHFPRVSRVASVSPLTLPALQAACLGVHLKRRRVACELLALRWDEGDEYWRDLNALLGDLCERMGEASRSLQEEVVTSRLSESSFPPGAPVGHTPPWTQPDIAIGAKGDFAPRSSEQQRILHHLDDVQREMAVAWTASVNVRRMVEDTSGEDDPPWSELRASLARIIRDVERARGVTRQTTASEEREMDIDSEAEAISPLPSFLQSWEDDATTARSTSIATTLPETDTEPAYEEVSDDVALPAVGRDEIYEATIPSGKRENENGLGKMSREARIALAKVAREQGLTLGELLRRQGGDTAANPQVVSGRRDKLAHEGLVQELQGMIGIIKRKKGQPVDAGSEDKKREDPHPSTLIDAGGEDSVIRQTQRQRWV